MTVDDRLALLKLLTLKAWVVRDFERRCHI